MSDYKLIPVADIHPDPNQPRKYYDEVAMQELILSVKSKGVLQPILVRPNGKGMLLVCGERRYRASKEAGLTEIPAVIRELNDDEALELQIIENLQRKDVHPMEEAVAFKSLKEKFSVEDIAIKVGKSPVFVAQRIKLTDLIEPFQEMLHLNKISLKDSISLCRESSEQQKEVFKEVTRYSGNWKKNPEWICKDAGRYISRSEQALDGAPFKRTDAALYPEMGACIGCQFNSASHPLLFPDLGKKSYCSNSVCFGIKKERSFQQKILKLTEDPNMLFVSTSRYKSDDAKLKIKAVESFGAKVLEDDVFERLEKPTPVDPWEKYQESWIDDPEDKEELAACKESYGEAVQEYKSDLKEYEEAVSSGKVRKAFVVSGYSEEGKVIDVVIKAAKGSKPGSGMESNTDVLLIDQEIAAIEQREKRNKELDGEKIHTQVQQILPECKEYISTPGSIQQLQESEIIAMVFAMAESASYGFRDKVRELCQIEIGYGSGSKEYKKLAGFTQLGLNELIRHFILDKLKVMNASHLNNAKALAIHNIALHYAKIKVDSIVQAQEEKATKRQVNYKKRLDALKAKRKELQPTETTQKKTSSKKSNKD